MKVGVPREIAPGERRVALVPAAIDRLIKAGLEVQVEAGAGEAAFHTTREYADVGARILPDPAVLYGQSDVILKVRRLQVTPDGAHEADLLPSGATVVSLFVPDDDPDLVARAAARGLSYYSMDLIPRISRAQPMDARSAMSTLAGYKAVLLAADQYGWLFPMLSTAAGTIPPAKVLVLGVGVAGLQAIATARRLGAVVSAFDVRPQVRQEVESLGARFLTIDVQSEQDASGYARGLSEEQERRQREQMTAFVRDADIVITTALVPGRRAPVLITADMVAQMKPRSVIVDLAGEQGGNCEWTEPGKTVERLGVTIMGPVNIPSMMPTLASRLYARTISSFLLNMVRDGALAPNPNDPIVAESCVVRAGEVVRATAAAALTRGIR
ncbi:MAG: Re/Si-specific NAD(P)(+) transhydrogenase subunit alpha [Armatimonadota bacterium]|nr:Re/Si-specific NAD(P)(+) transhydrogenase subunit alpha [Armatimonadota bacterium]MDR7454474.1 Re/Si-specific NAD(P)(+) transhydrogenase subunit alpha [Armatimonadota bacterium]MDR7458031.1 Re/Si-specific NAD(P)(+) transhydrogenase subunit alpha [Armatimonadota bacterium]MDR7497064.1 Re/Si-specific NAD(P)(+) transhydrogenase subunit alpha [Armatimonadota bacterium]MDR7512141.1 Re/Si-specific NAD(P)(+) transhydrogenase subunit alpha [Armatimonadota bacterium]